jgi:hypothetical protein
MTERVWEIGLIALPYVASNGIQKKLDVSFPGAGFVYHKAYTPSGDHELVSRFQPDSRRVAFVGWYWADVNPWDRQAVRARWAERLTENGVAVVDMVLFREDPKIRSTKYRINFESGYEKRVAVLVRRISKERYNESL